MLENYQLMHKDIPCGVLIIDSDNQTIEAFSNTNREYAPFLGNADERLMKKWWEARTIPASRDSINELLRKAGYSTTREYLMKNLALSLTDTYWVQPIDAGAKWADVNLYTLSFAGGKIPYHSQASYDPNATLGGQMDKYWDIQEKPPVLVKTAYKAYGQQAINEAFATEIHKRQGCSIPYVEYGLRNADDNGIQSFCRSFTSENIELVPAMEISDSTKVPNSASKYDSYISICTKHGLDESEIRDFLDYQTLTDFVISNIDRHYLNFGVLRNADTMKFIAPAPIFDSGNSMFYDESNNRPMTRTALLKRRTRGMYDSEENYLRRVTQKQIVKTDLLPSPKEVKQFYTEHGLPEKRAEVIAANYENKIMMLLEFQKGKTISAYKEKQKGRNPIKAQGILKSATKQTRSVHKTPTYKSLEEAQDNSRKNAKDNPSKGKNGHSIPKKEGKNPGE